MKLKSFVATGTVGLLAIIGAAQVGRWACSLMAVALTYWGGWDIAEAAHAAPWIIVASASGLAMRFMGCMRTTNGISAAARKNRPQPCPEPGVSAG